MMARPSRSVAVVLPLVFAALVIGFLLGAVLLQGEPRPTTLTEDGTSHPGQDPPSKFWPMLVVAGLPWSILSPFVITFLFILIGLTWDSSWFEVLGTLAFIASPFINFFLLYAVGLQIDKGLEWWRSRRRSEETKP
jgi:hypothetical protein